MKIYSIFDDYDEKSIHTLEEAGVELTVHPLGMPRPDSAQMEKILENYDGVIIGTSQKITGNMFEGITTEKIIATASVGVDHIEIPVEKRSLVKIFNTPMANAKSVAEYTMGCALASCKRFYEGNSLYWRNLNNKALNKKPEDLYGKTLGVVGAGNISKMIMEYGKLFGMKIICWTRNPEKHRELEKENITFVSLDTLAKEANVISVNLPNNHGTRGLISNSLISKMKNDAIFISVSRLETIDYKALFRKALENPQFYVCLDIDVNYEVVATDMKTSNVMVTPHIAGGTVETRIRMFNELANQISEYVMTI